MSGSPRYGNSQALHKHDLAVTSPRPKHTTPAPGHYEVGVKHNVKFTSPRGSSFGGNLCRVDRSSTGMHGPGIKGATLPGPNSYSVDASRQSIDIKARAPTYKFGSSSRDDSGRMFTSKVDTDIGSGTENKLASPRTVDQDPNRISAGKFAPGPGAYGTMHHSLGTTKPKSPSYSFGLPRSPRSRNETGVEIGPGRYSHSSTLGMQSVSTRPSSPRFCMGSSTREGEAFVSAPDVEPLSKTSSPGPSKYNQPSGVGKQSLSNRHSSNAWSFGTDEKIKISPRDKKVPGPGEYDAQSMLCLQQQSVYKSYGGFKFGTSDRIPIGNKVG